MFNKTFFVAVVLCACFFSATLARPQLGSSVLSNPTALLGAAGSVIPAPLSGALTGLGTAGVASAATGLASAVPAAVLAAAPIG